LGIPHYKKPSSVFSHTLWQTYKKLWKIAIFNGKIHYKWPFSIAMLNYQRVSFLFMSSDVSCQTYPNPAGYEPRQTAAEKSNGPFFDPPIFGAVLKTSVRDVAVTVKVSVMFFFARHHDQPRHRSDMNFTFGH